ncbi:MAG: hypothetical protein WBB34_05595 [Xanthobacteraceae bacterium]
MFPNVRLMIVAVLASIMGISCALGLFAEFRVSHDSFLRESNAGTPLQLGLSGAATVMDSPATFEIRFPAQPAPRAAGTDINHQTFDRAVATPGATAAPTQQREPAAVPATATNAPQSPPDVASTPQAVASPAASDTVAEPATPAATGSTTGQDSALSSQQNPQPKTADSRTPDNKPGDGTPADNADIKPAGSKPAETKPAETKPAETKPADNLADRTPAASSAARDAAGAPSRPARDLKLAPQHAPAAVARKRTTVRHRPLIARRVPRTRAVAPAPSFTATQPAYQWMPQIQSAQPIRRRLIIRRSRPVRNSAQSTPPAIPSTSAANAPE